jgi:hypothetical protein
MPVYVCERDYTHCAVLEELEPSWTILRISPYHFLYHQIHLFSML